MPETASQKHLLILSPPGGTPLQFELKGKRVGLGRAPDNHIRVDFSQVSASHMEFELDEGEYAIRDLGSTNGVTVNGVEVKEPTKIRDGDRLMIGRTIPAHYLVVAEGEKATAAASYSGAADQAKAAAFASMDEKIQKLEGEAEKLEGQISKLKAEHDAALAGIKETEQNIRAKESAGAGAEELNALQEDLLMQTQRYKVLASDLYGQQQKLQELQSPAVKASPKPALPPQPGAAQPGSAIQNPLKPSTASQPAPQPANPAPSPSPQAPVPAATTAPAAQQPPVQVPVPVPATPATPLTPKPAAVAPAQPAAPALKPQPAKPGQPLKPTTQDSNPAGTSALKPSTLSPTLGQPQNPLTPSEPKSPALSPPVPIESPVTQETTPPAIPPPLQPPKPIDPVAQLHPELAPVVPETPKPVVPVETPKPVAPLEPTTESSGEDKPAKTVLVKKKESDAAPVPVTPPKPLPADSDDGAESKTQITKPEPHEPADKDKTPEDPSSEAPKSLKPSKPQKVEEEEATDSADEKKEEVEAPAPITPVKPKAPTGLVTEEPHAEQSSNEVKEEPEEKPTFAEIAKAEESDDEDDDDPVIQLKPSDVAPKEEPKETKEAAEETPLEAKEEEVTPEPAQSDSSEEDRPNKLLSQRTTQGAKPSLALQVPGGSGGDKPKLQMMGKAETPERPSMKLSTQPPPQRKGLNIPKKEAEEDKDA